MTVGVGGSTTEQELARLSRQTDYVPISIGERRKRLRAQRLMVEQGIDALYLYAWGTSLFYFTGLRLWASERLHGAVIPAQGFGLHNARF